MLETQLIHILQGFHMHSVLRENEDEDCIQCSWLKWSLIIIIIINFFLLFNPFFVITHLLLSFCVNYLDWNSNFSSNKIVLKPSSYRKTQLIILSANQLRKDFAKFTQRGISFDEGATYPNYLPL